jgi:hypothetical protein
MIPVHLDALFLQQEETVLDTMADFSRLPYHDGKKQLDVNPDIAYVSEEIVSHPFQDQGFHLKRGVHLHWALPDALTQGVNTEKPSPGGKTEKSMVFPAVPNRWLITRSKRNNNEWTPERHWVVESDYLYPEGTSYQVGSITFPVEPKPEDGRFQPYRYMGRKMPLAAWKENETADPDMYLNAMTSDGLTAMGYGDPSFAAFYPNCHSVFGLHDEDISTQEDFRRVCYDVIGWYSDSKRDCLQTTGLHQAMKAIQQRVWREHQASGEALPPLDKTDDLDEWYDKHIPDLTARHEALEQHYEWTVNDKDREPRRSLFYAVLEPEDPVFNTDPAKETNSISVAVGNTGTEALSAYLASQLDGDKLIIEEQLEALDLAWLLNHRQLDIGPKFHEARHNKGFKARRSGILWTVRLQSNPDAMHPQSNSQAKRHPEATAPVTLPAYLAHPLNQLNEAQRKYDKAQQEIDSLRRQIYDDWTLFMLASHPPAWLNTEFPDPAEISHFMQRAGLLTLKKKLAYAGSVAFERENTGGTFIGATTPPHVASTALASILAEKVRKMVGAIKVANEILGWLTAIDRAVATAQKSDITNNQAQALVVDLTKVLEQLELSPVPATMPLTILRDRIRKAANDLPTRKDATAFLKTLEALLTTLKLVAELRYALQQLEAPRFYQPCDPVVLIAGDAVRPTDRHGTDSTDKDGKHRLLPCKLLQLNGTVEDKLETIRSKVLEEIPDGDQIGALRWKQQPWNPFLMEWQVEIFPRKQAGNLHPDRKAFESSFIKDNYELPETRIDLVTRPGAVAVTGTTDTGIYSGSCILTDYAPLLLKEKLASYLNQRDEKEESSKPAIENLRAVQKHLVEHPNIMSQALGGFHEALLQHHQLLQLPIRDPQGFADFKHLTEAVRAVCEHRVTGTPLRGNDFMPIRSGQMKLLQLRLVDTFGRVKPVIEPGDAKPVVTTEVMQTPGSPHLINLTPRLVQPACINFRWLSAEYATGRTMDEPETNAHPAFTPVCGWIVPNNLDSTLLIYDNRGRALGSIAKASGQIVWEPAPVTGLPKWDILNANADSQRINPHLRKLVDTIINEVGAEDPSFLDHFITSLDNALETISPEASAHQESRALLMGRPIAVVRAVVDLELSGRPAINQSLNAFWQDMVRAVEPEEVAMQGSARRAQFTVTGEEAETFRQAFAERDPTAIKPIFKRCSIRLPVDSDITILAEDGGGQIHLPTRSYRVMPDGHALHVLLDNDRTIDAFTQVRFPIRIGEYQQLNDGLVGYWIEESDDQGYHYKGNMYYAPQAGSLRPLEPDLSAGLDGVREELNRQKLPASIRDRLEAQEEHPLAAGVAAHVTIEKTGHRWRIDAENRVYSVIMGGESLHLFEVLNNSSDHIKVHWKEPVNLYQSIDDPPQKLTMLVDPHGPVHAVSGILPTKSIEIPADQYAEALRKLEVSFLAAPILTGPGKLAVPLPDEPGYQWSWLAREKGRWQETGDIDKVDPKAHFSGQSQIVEGWLKLRMDKDK